MPLYLTKINLQKYIFEITYNCFLRSISLVLSISSAPKDILGEGGGGMCHPKCYQSSEHLIKKKKIVEHWDDLENLRTLKKTQRVLFSPKNVATYIASQFTPDIEIYLYVDAL